MINKVISLLESASSVAIYTHINTDCDAMGSSLALKEVLEQKGKEVDVFANSAFPNNFSFFGDLSFVNQKNNKSKYDLVVCLDAAGEGRLGKYKYTYRKNIKNTLNIDHHITNERFCKTNFVKSASSTCEILFDILCAMKITFTKTICKYLISGIATDTGKFSHSATQKTFTIVSKLLRFGGLKMEEITGPLFNSMTTQVFELLQRAYSQIEFFADKKLALIMFSRKDFEETKTTLDDVDVFPDIPLQLEKVEFAILASEDDKGYFRVSLRSKGEISAREVAESFGGGGHLNASGCKIFGEFNEVKEKLISNTLEIMGWKR